MAAQFIAPVIQNNPDGWGPCALPSEFQDIPYQPFSKADRIGKVSKWHCFLEGGRSVSLRK